MKKLIVLVFALGILASAQNTPAPCDPANIQYTNVQYGCYNTPDCVSGFMCFFLHVGTDVVYGTTCSVDGQYLCGRPNIAQEEKSSIFAMLLPDSLKILHAKANSLRGFQGKRAVACKPSQKLMKGGSHGFTLGYFSRYRSSKRTS